MNQSDSLRLSLCERTIAGIANVLVPLGILIPRVLPKLLSTIITLYLPDKVAIGKIVLTLLDTLKMVGWKDEQSERNLFLPLVVAIINGHFDCFLEDQIRVNQHSLLRFVQVLYFRVTHAKLSIHDLLQLPILRLRLDLKNAVCGVWLERGWGKLIATCVAATKESAPSRMLQILVKNRIV